MRSKDGALSIILGRDHETAASLQKTLPPRGPEFGFVSREWPRMRGPNGWVQQYKTLNLRLRAAAKSSWTSRGWWRPPSRVTIQPVPDSTCGRLRVSRSWPQLQHISPERRTCVFVLIGEFLGEGGVSAARPYQVLPSSLALVGTSAWGRKKDEDLRRTMTSSSEDQRVSFAT